MDSILEFVNLKQEDYKSKMVLTFREVQYLYYLLEERIKDLEGMPIETQENRLVINRELKNAKKLQAYFKSEKVESPNIQKWANQKQGTEGVDGITAASINLLTGDIDTKEPTAEQKEELKKMRKAATRKSVDEILAENQVTMF